ncbi:MAG: hypothetical protein R2784_13720 [Saprospiraceae bacterium]
MPTIQKVTFPGLNFKSTSVHPKDLLDKSNPYYQEHIRGREFEEDELVEYSFKESTFDKIPYWNSWQQESSALLYTQGYLQITMS